MTAKFCTTIYGCVALCFAAGLIALVQGNQAVSCSQCFSQKWEWTAWQCNVNCNVGTTSYGDVDAFSAGLLGVTDGKIHTVIDQIIKWDKIYLNMQNSYDPQTGKFVVKVAGVYTTAVHVFSPDVSFNLMANVGIFINRAANGGGEEKLCDSAATPGYNQNTCSVDLELDKDDELYVKSIAVGAIWAPTGQFFASFKASIMYKKLK